MKKKEKIKNTFKICKRSIDKDLWGFFFYTAFVYFSIYQILVVIFIFSFCFIIFDTPKNFQQKFANCIYYFPCYYLIVTLLIIYSITIVTFS